MKDRSRISNKMYHYHGRGIVMYYWSLGRGDRRPHGWYVFPGRSTWPTREEWEDPNGPWPGLQEAADELRRLTPLEAPPELEAPLEEAPPAPAPEAGAEPPAPAGQAPDQLALFT